MSKKNRAGIIVLDFLVSGLVAGTAMLGIFVSVFLSTAHLLQKTELYFLARSRLYQNTTDCSARSHLWPAFSGLEVAYDCGPGSKIVSRMSVFGRHYSTQTLSLEKGR